MNILIVTGFLIFVDTPSWAFIDSVVGGVRTVADQAHQKILENQLVQLVLEAKKNYDASMKIYKQVKQLNEGRGLVRNVVSDLGAKAKTMGQDEKDRFDSDLTYRGDSDLDRAIDAADSAARRGLEDQGMAVVDGYGNAVNRRSKAYADAFKRQAKEIWERQERGKAGRATGVQIAQTAPDLSAKALGLELQANSDAVQALNDLLKIEMMRDADAKRKGVVSDKTIDEALKFLADRQGMARALQESFFLVRLSRAPALFLGTRQAVSKLVSIMVALFLAAGLLYEYSRNGRANGVIIPEVIGLPLVMVIFGLLFYDKIMVAFAVAIDAMEQTISPGDAIIKNTMETSGRFVSSFINIMNMDYWIKFSSIFMGFLSWTVNIVFLWVRFALFCLLYALGPLFIAMSLFAPLKKMTYGWMTSVLHVGLWGIFMRILTLVVTTSGISAFMDPGGNIIKSIFASLVVNLIFLAFAVLTPYFIHSIIGGHVGSHASGLLTAVKGKAGTLAGVGAGGKE